MKRIFLFLLFSFLINSIVLAESVKSVPSSGFLKISNVSNFTMIKGSEHSYKMRDWTLPDSIDANEVKTVPVTFVDVGDVDAIGNTIYYVKCPNGQMDKITFIARGAFGDQSLPSLLIKQDGSNCVGIKQPSDGDIGWVKRMYDSVSATIVNK